MIKNTHPGLFIAFEGLDGSGAEMQASLLRGILAKEGYRVLLTKEPTNYLIGGLIRGYLTKEWKTSPESLQLLFAADRCQHLDREVIPNLEAGKVVITDRYAFSSISFGSLDCDPLWIEKINEKFIIPDITFLVKVRPKICALRMKESHYEMELFKEEQKLIRVWKMYEKLAKKYSNFYIINGERDEMEIIQEIVDVVKKELGIGKHDRPIKLDRRKK